MKELEKNEIIAICIQPLLMAVDMVLKRLDENVISIEQVKKVSNKMLSHDSRLAAWPFPETMRKAEIMESQTETFIKLIELLEVRKVQIEIAKKSNVTPGAEVLQQLGF